MLIKLGLQLHCDHRSKKTFWFFWEWHSGEGSRIVVNTHMGRSSEGQVMQPHMNGLCKHSSHNHNHSSHHQEHSVFFPSWNLPSSDLATQNGPCTCSGDWNLSSQTLVHYFECLLAILQLDRHCKVIQNLLSSLSWSFKLTFCTSLPIEPGVNRFFEIHSVVMMHPPQIIISHTSWSLQPNLHFTAVCKASSYALRILHDYCLSIPELRRPGTMVNEISDWATRDNHSNLWQEWKREQDKIMVSTNAKVSCMFSDHWYMAVTGYHEIVTDFLSSCKCIQAKVKTLTNIESQ